MAFKRSALSKRCIDIPIKISIQRCSDSPRKLSPAGNDSDRPRHRYHIKRNSKEIKYCYETTKYQSAVNNHSYFAKAQTKYIENQNPKEVTINQGEPIAVQPNFITTTQCCCV